MLILGGRKGSGGKELNPARGMICIPNSKDSECFKRSRISECNLDHVINSSVFLLQDQRPDPPPPRPP